jgi:hypothetical protein
LASEIDSQLKSTEDNPIDTYLKAKNDGWAAHLVPYSCTATDEING